MRIFTCPTCGTRADFTAMACPTCGALLAYVPERDDLAALVPLDGGGFGETRPSGGAYGRADPVWWRCLNTAWGCNWVLDASSGAVWCRSCRLTRGRPDDQRPDAVDAWAVTEVAKRRLVRQVFVLGLPLEAGAPGPLDALGGVVFDLVHLDADHPGVTGHFPGVITIDLREADDSYREAARRSLGEQDRTLLGHLRHEVGHHLWRVLVDARGLHESCRAVFGDERADYAAAIDAHYARRDTTVPDHFVTRYASMHPAEDWAETFAHVLAWRDALETADAFGLGVGPAPRARPATGASEDIERWSRLAEAAGALAQSLGHRPPYPYAIGHAVAAKLRYVDRLIRDATTAPPS